MTATKQLRLVTDAPPAHYTTADPVRQVFEHWVFMFGLRAATTKLGPKRKPVITGALALGYTAAELMLAVDGMASASLDGKPEGMQDRMREIDWFLADEVRIERCIRHGEKLRELAARQVTARPVVCEDEPAADPVVAAAARERLRVLATAANKRVPYWPEVPTFVELGMSDLEISAWSALFVPAGTPAAVQQKLNAIVRRSTDAPESVATRQRTGSLAMQFSLEESRRFVAGEIERWGRFVKDSGVKLE